MYLFIDSTHSLTIGLWEKENSWSSLASFSTKKSSEILHTEIYKMLENTGLKLMDIKGLIKIAGPGSYTGMRLSEGFSQVLDWQGLDVYSFYHFQVPHLLGQEEGQWFCKAFKGEFLLYQWRKEINERFLLSKNDFLEVIKKKNEVYTHFKDNDIDIKQTQTSQMIKDNPGRLFENVISQNLKEDIYYFRPQNVEFTKPKKSC